MRLSALCGIFSNIRQDIKELMFTALILLTLIALVYVFIRFEQTRVWVGSLIVFVMFCTSLVSGFKIYQYFSASGGTVGDVISSIFGSSNAEKVGDYSFKFNNLVFKSTANENEYKATYQDIYSNESGSFDLDMTKNWNIYINDNVANNNVIGANYVFADYVYTFYDDSLKELLTDTLKIKFVFYNNYYQIDLITNNGETATEFWQSYFTKDNIIVSLKINNYIQDEEINYDTSYVSIVVWASKIYADENSSTYAYPFNLESSITLKIKNMSSLEYEDYETFNLYSLPHKLLNGIHQNDDEGRYLTRATYHYYIPINSFGDYYYQFNNVNDTFANSHSTTNFSGYFNLKKNRQSISITFSLE